MYINRPFLPLISELSEQSKVMKRIYLIVAVLITVFVAACKENVVQIVLPEVSESAVNFIVANDLGRNGYYEQKPIARLMGYTAEQIDLEMIAAAGDVHHFEGVASVVDPLWMTNYELIYDHPELMIEWNAVCGNHEYRGNTQAVLDYTNISRRWNVPARYYTRVIQSDDGAACRLLFVDTSPLIDKYRNDSITYPDAHKQDVAAQLRWIDSVLTQSTEKWKIVIGHHPAYADTKKDDSEKTDIQARLVPVMEKHKVNIYFCGHIHNFQHIRTNSSPVNYIVNSAGSLSRPVKKTDGTLFCSGDPGFTLCSIDATAIRFFFINHKGETVYSYIISQ
jgi:hypothetical protein